MDCATAPRWSSKEWDGHSHWHPSPAAQHQGEGFTYSSKQATNCAGCGVRKHTPLRVDDMGGYVCLTCIDNRLGELLEPERHQCEPVAYRWCVKGRGEWTASVCKVEFDARANDERFVAQALYAEPPAKRQGEPVGEVVHVSEDQIRIGLYDEYSLKVGDLVYAEQTAPVAVVIDIESAANKFAQCMGCTWEHISEQGRQSMREHAKAVVDASRPSGMKP